MNWFSRDDNVIPALYLLQPIRDKLPDYVNDAEPDKKKEVMFFSTSERQLCPTRLLIIVDICSCVLVYRCKQRIFSQLDVQNGPKRNNHQTPIPVFQARSAWWKDFEKMQLVLREASSKAFQNKNKTHKYYWAGQAHYI